MGTTTKQAATGSLTEARSIIAKAVRQRAFLLRNRIGTSDPAMPSRIARLQTWLERNPVPSLQTLRDLWIGSLGVDLRAVIPHNTGGNSMLLHFSSILNQP